jgi:hypothetical protein
MHEIECTGANIYLPLMTFIKTLYPTYSHNVESLQESDQMKSMAFEKMVNKFVDREKEFRKKPTPSTGEYLPCL